MKRTICIALVLVCSLCSQAADRFKLSTVAIDAGHGGSDPGCVSKDNKTYEKTITLDVAKSLKAKIEQACPDVKVVLTRSVDEYVTLDERAQRANKAGANLFISLHINASPNTSPNGYSVHILGKSSNKNRDLFAYNLDVCKRENSVIMLEDDYSTKYQNFDPNDPESYIFMVFMQSAFLQQSLRFAQTTEKHLSKGPIKGDRGIWQDPFYVLWKTSMPAVLVELGFISNMGDLALLKDQKQREALSDCLLNAFVEYKTIYDRSVDVSETEKADVDKTDNIDTSKTEVKEVATAKAKETSTVKTNKSENQSKPEVAKEAAVTKTDNAKASKTEKAEEQETAETATQKDSYAVQIFASTSIKDENEKSLFLGYTHFYIKSGNLYKYYIGDSDLFDDAKKILSAIKKNYPDAFIVKIPASSTRNH